MPTVSMLGSSGDPLMRCCFGVTSSSRYSCDNCERTPRVVDAPRASLARGVLTGVAQMLALRPPSKPSIGDTLLLWRRSMVLRETCPQRRGGGGSKGEKDLLRNLGGPTHGGLRTGLPVNAFAGSRPMLTSTLSLHGVQTRKAHHTHDQRCQLSPQY